METFSALLAVCAAISPHEEQWRGASMFSLICARINGWVNNGEAGDSRRRHAHYDATVMSTKLANTIRRNNFQRDISCYNPIDYLGYESSQ